MSELLAHEIVADTSGRTHLGTDVGVKVRLEDAVPADKAQWAQDVKKLGEHIARARSLDADRVWVWVYGNDMDILGPALCVSYIEKGGIPATEFTPREAMMLYYLGMGPSDDANVTAEI